MKLREKKQFIFVTLQNFLAANFATEIRIYYISTHFVNFWWFFYTQYKLSKRTMNLHECLSNIFMEVHGFVWGSDKKKISAMFVEIYSPFQKHYAIFCLVLSLTYSSLKHDEQWTPDIKHDKQWTSYHFTNMLVEHILKANPNIYMKLFLQVKVCELFSQ